MSLNRPIWSHFLLWILLAAGIPGAEAKVQFDVFPGYDNSVRAGAWYPVTIEVFNDGPSFDSVVELSAGQFGSMVVRIPVELPTNTRKRFSVPLFCMSQTYLAIDSRLLDSKGKVQEERPGQRVNLVAWELPILGALPGNYAGLPAYPEAEKNTRPELAPRVARLQPEIFPDNSIALEGLSSLYLNTARALELKEPQVEALRAWVNSGGQLIVAVDQPNDVSATAWLQTLLPASIQGQANVQAGADLQRWLTRGDWNPGFAFRAGERADNSAAGRKASATLAPDPTLDSPMPMLDLRAVRGSTVKLADGRPWMVASRQGRGQVVLLALNPEREPFKSWKNRPWFWAKLTAVPQRFLSGERQDFQMSRGIDGIIGAMIETRQVRKLPVGALLLLLLVYLAVIGPLDQWWLKKINRPMLTWVTFPAYVALFSGLIYFIGYKLRAGQTEWNELQVVDVVPDPGSPARTLMRGRTFAGLYSPANNTYPMATRVPGASLRGEFRNLYGGTPDPGKATATVEAQELKTELFVPVWTSTMNVTDWVEQGEAPLAVRALGDGRVEAENRGSKPLGPVWLVQQGKLARVESLAPGSRVTLDAQNGDALGQRIESKSSLFSMAVTQRENTFGSGDRVFIDDWAESSMLASFPSRVSGSSGGGFNYAWPAGFDLGPELDRGDAVVLAWLADDGILPPANQFTALKSRRGSLLRLTLSSPR